MKGEITPYLTLKNVVNVSISVKTISTVNIVYCDGSNDLYAQSIKKPEKGEVKVWDIRLPANVALLDAVLTDVGIRCSLLGPSGLQHFYLSSNRGVYVPKVQDPKSMYGVMTDVMEKASHLLWLAGSMLTIIIIVLILVPACMRLYKRKITNKQKF